MSIVVRTNALALVLALAPAGCSKHSDATAGSPVAAADGGTVSAASPSSSAASAPTAEAIPGVPTFGSGFEGAIVMHVSGAKMNNDVLFVTKNGKLRIDVPTPDGHVAHSLFDSATQKITVLMDSQELAMEMPIPAQKTPGGAAGGTQSTQLTRTGKHETIAGYDCEDWQITTTNGNHEAVCVAQGLAFFDFSAMAGPTGGGTRSWAEELRDKNAFPLRAVETDPSGKEISRMEVTKIQKKQLDDATFAIPPNYHLMRIPGLGGAGTMPAIPGMPPGAPGAPTARPNLK